MTSAPAPSASLGEVVLALDIGTSSTRCLAFDLRGQQVPGLSAVREYHAHAAADGGSELDPLRLASDAEACLAEASAAVAASHGSIVAVGVCTFWHAFLGVDESGAPLTPIYLWNDNRAGAQAVALRTQLNEREVHRRTGCVLHPSFLPARLLWLKETDPARFARCKHFLSPGEYLESRWFGSARCGLSMASGTGLLNQITRHWDEEVLNAVGIPAQALAPLVATHALREGLQSTFATSLQALRNVSFFPALGDGACSNVGSGATQPDRAALMVGTSAAMRILLPGDAPPPPAGLWRYLLDGNHALIGGALSNGGNLYAWLRDTLRAGSEAEIEQWLAKAEPDCHGLIVLPFFSGERNPDYPLNATGAIAGLRLATTPQDIVQAGLEAVAFRLAAIADRLRQAQPELQGYLASGGFLHSPAWVRMITDVLGLPVTFSSVQEASARGAALMALQGIGAIPSALDVPIAPGMTIMPDPERQAAFARARERHERFYAHWKADSASDR
jgi:gluconokinase